jgi:hypothetical protein
VNAVAAVIAFISFENIYLEDLRNWPSFIPHFIPAMMFDDVPVCGYKYQEFYIRGSVRSHERKIGTDNGIQTIIFVNLVFSCKHNSALLTMFDHFLPVSKRLSTMGKEETAKSKPKGVLRDISKSQQTFYPQEESESSSQHIRSLPRQ